MRRSVQRLQCTVSLWLEYDALDICDAFGVFSETQFVIIHRVFYGILFVVHLFLKSLK